MSLTPSVQASLSHALAADANSLGKLKLQAGQNAGAAIRETAKQFESLFMRELIKSMREATMKSGLLDNPGGDLAADLLDQQFAVQMSGQPGGLSELIAQQLARQMGVNPQDAGAGQGAAIDRSAGHSALQRAQSLAAYGRQTTGTTGAPASFVQRLAPAAARIEQETGIPAAYMLGQAGLETGWGQNNIRTASGAPSHNLFGIKAGPGWTGRVAEVTTTEYVNGVAEKQVARFRAYDSVEESFRDYARLISQTPRYAQVMAQTGSAQAFASSLQQAGYATDPQYAAKLSRTIETAQRLQSQGAVQALAS